MAETTSGPRPKKLRVATVAKGVLKRVAHPRHLWTAIALQRDRKRDRAAHKRVRGDAQLQLISQLLPSGFLHYGYFDDPGCAAEAISLNDMLAAQLRYAVVLAEQVHDRSAPVLDVGCGMGGLIGLFERRGFTPVALTPDAWQITHVRARYPGVETVHAKFEELPAEAHAGRYGTVVTSESLQYLKLDEALPLMAAVLKRGGRWVACDYFRTGPPDPSAARGRDGNAARAARDRSGHRWDEFRTRLAGAGWDITLQRDITPNVLPTLRYLHMWGSRFGLPLLEFGIGKLRRKHPGMHYVLQDALRETQGVLADNLRIVDPESFVATKRYMLLVMTRR